MCGLYKECFFKDSKIMKRTSQIKSADILGTSKAKDVNFQIFFFWKNF